MNPEPTISVNVDPTNPGQFFACCGLLELADRLWQGAEGWFDESLMKFHIANSGKLAELVECLLESSIEQLELDNDTSSPIRIGEPYNITIDWWKSRPQGDSLKVWAGSMRSCHIAIAMRNAIRNAPEFDSMFDYGCVVYEIDNPKKKVEPFYFDSRRGPSSDSLDIGFSPNVLKFTTIAHPAVEFLCLIGLQRCFPAFTDKRRVFDFYTWSTPIESVLLPVVITGHITGGQTTKFRFSNAYRTSQKKHKSFLPAQIGE